MKKLAATLLIACAALLSGPAIHAEMPALPPPSIATTPGEIRVPKALQRAFLEQVYPSYLAWLGSGDGPEDSLPAFEFYLTLHPVHRFEHDCFVRMYIDLG